MWITLNFSSAFNLDISNTNPGDVKVMNSTGITQIEKISPYRKTPKRNLETAQLYSA
jgi:hypothetical protein